MQPEATVRGKQIMKGNKRNYYLNVNILLYHGYSLKLIRIAQYRKKNEKLGKRKKGKFEALRNSIKITHFTFINGDTNSCFEAVINRQVASSHYC